MECPIKTSLGALGKKRTILTIRDIWFRKIVRFNLAHTIYSRPNAEGSF